MAKISVTVTADVPDGVSLEEWIGYVQEAVASNIGMYPPEEPIFHLNRASVVVKKTRTLQPA